MNETHIETLHGILDPERRQPGAQQVRNLLTRIRKYSPDITDNWCTKTVTEIALSEVRALLKRTSGFTFEAKSLRLENIEEFSNPQCHRRTGRGVQHSSNHWSLRPVA